MTIKEINQIIIFNEYKIFELKLFANTNNFSTMEINDIIDARKKLKVEVRCLQKSIKLKLERKKKLEKIKNNSNIIW